MSDKNSRETSPTESVMTTLTEPVQPATPEELKSDAAKARDGIKNLSLGKAAEHNPELRELQCNPRYRRELEEARSALNFLEKVRIKAWTEYVGGDLRWYTRIGNNHLWNEWIKLHNFTIDSTPAWARNTSSSSAESKETTSQNKEVNSTNNPSSNSSSKINDLLNKSTGSTKVTDFFCNFEDKKFSFFKLEEDDFFNKFLSKLIDFIKNFFN